MFLCTLQGTRVYGTMPGSFNFSKWNSPVWKLFTGDGFAGFLLNRGVKDRSSFFKYTLRSVK